LRLEIAGTTLSPASPASALAVIANYVFDSLPEDAYAFHDGRLHESRVTLAAPGGAPHGLSDPTLLERVSVSFEHVPVEGEPEIDPDFRFLLDEYQTSLGDGAVVIPTSALACLRALSRLSTGRFLLLSADKGHCREEELLYRGDPAILFHGSVSLMVN